MAGKSKKVILCLFVLISLLIFAYAFGLSTGAYDDTTTIIYYLNANSSPILLCQGPQNALGSLDSTSLGSAQVQVAARGAGWNSFCSSFPTVLGSPVTITSVGLILYVCCAGKNPYSLFSKLIDDASSPQGTVLASFTRPLSEDISGSSCSNATKITVEIPPTPGAILSSGSTLSFQFQLLGKGSVTLCTGSSDGSSITLAGTSIITSSTTTSTSSQTTTHSTTSSTSASKSSTSTTLSHSKSASNTATTTASKVTTTTSASSSTSPIDFSSSTSSSSVSRSESASSRASVSNVSGFLPIPGFNNSLVFPGVLVGIVVIASSLIALGGKRSGGS